MSIDKWLAPRKSEISYLKSTGSLKSRTSNFLEPESEKEFKWHSESVKSSMKSSKEFLNDEFTNFLNGSIKGEFHNNIYDIVKNLNSLRDYGLDPDFEITQRLKRIFSLYIDMNGIEEDRIAKIRVETHADTSTGLRLYILIDINAYKIILIDPLHLAITSAFQRKEKTFLRNKGNGLCMSKEIKRVLDY